MKELAHFIPNNSLALIKNWVQPYQVTIKVVKKRKNKLGDYKRLTQLKHQITVNNDLTSLSFLFVLTHEIAHLIAYSKYGSRIQPHGKEWKKTFHDLLIESLKCYPENLQSIILKHAIQPKANVLSDRNIATKLLCIFNPDKPRLEDLEEGQKFKIGTKSFRMIKKIKIRYFCQELSTERLFSIHGLAEIDEIL